MPRIAPLSSQEFEKFLLSIGCHFKRKKGSHKVYNKPGLNRPIIFPETKEITVNVILFNLRTLKMNREEFLKKIGKS